MPSPKLRGCFIWHELLTSDTKAAAAFYTKVVGWTTKPAAHVPDYTLFSAPTGDMAGLMMVPEDARAMGVQPNWVSYIGTPDLERTIAQTRQLGGRVHKDVMAIPSVGRFAVLQDPQGAAFAAFTPAGEGMGGGNGMPAMGDFSWHELATSDWSAAFDFYQKLFGWEKTSSMDMGEMGVYQMFGWKDQPLGGMYNRPPGMPGPPAWLPYAKVKDARTSAGTTKNRNGQIINGPMQVPGGDWIAQGIDPQGAMFAVHSAIAVVQAAPAKKAPAAKKAEARKTAAKKKVTKKAARKATPKKKAAKKQVTKKKATKKAAPRKKTAKKAARKSVRGKTGARAKAAMKKKAAKKTAKRKR